ncbi:MAG: formate/nitrite transporter family protein [Oscillospiraceae bacterium]|nr:formate/nitrite transporter family protein [Oscillospiraceae bacterium]
MKKLSLFLYAVLAGMSISIGGMVFLALDSKVLGAVFFSIGLFMVLVFGFNLFTGKVCYLFNNPPSYILDLLIIIIGNLVGAVICGLLLQATRMESVCAKAASMCATKLGDSLISIFILAMFCNIMIFVAVDNFKNNPHDFGKYLGILLAIPVFILCSFEHCVANMFYITAGSAWSGKAALYLVVMILGNAVGGVIIPLCRNLKVKSEK